MSLNLGMVGMVSPTKLLNQSEYLVAVKIQPRDFKLLTNGNNVWRDNNLFDCIGE